ncbi:MAG: hypothetical protein ACMG6H_01420, partial [Acidobacteriota bacterium]
KPQCLFLGPGRFSIGFAGGLVVVGSVAGAGAGGMSALAKWRQQVIAHRQLINTPCDRDCVFLYIVFEDAPISIEIRMPRRFIAFFRLIVVRVAVTREAWKPQ